LRKEDDRSSDGKRIDHLMEKECLSKEIKLEKRF
jgi:hypothetical protein